MEGLTMRNDYNDLSVMKNNAKVVKLYNDYEDFRRLAFDKGDKINITFDAYLAAMLYIDYLNETFCKDNEINYVDDVLSKECKCEKQ